MPVLYQPQSDYAIIIYGMCLIAAVVTAVIVSALALMDMGRD